MLVVLLLAAGCGPKSPEARMRNADKKSDQIGVLLDDAERFSGQIEPKKAEEALREVDKLLSDPDMQLSPDREIFAGRYTELLQKLNEVREARRAKDIEEAVVSERAEIGPSLQAMKDAAEAVSGPKVDEKLVAAAKDSVTALEKAVGASDDRRVLALKDPSFMGYLKRAKAETERARAALNKAEKKLAFLAGPAALKAKAAKDFADSKTEKDVEKKRELLTASVTGFTQCQTTGLELAKGLTGEKIAAEGAPVTAEAFVDTCKTAQKASDQALAKLPRPAKPKPAPAPKKAKK